MAAKKDKKPQPSEQPKQTLLFLKPKPVEETPVPIQEVAPVVEVVEKPIGETPVIPKPVLKSPKILKDLPQKKDAPIEKSEIVPDNQDNGDGQPDHQPIFQAVGIIVGDVRFDEEAKGTVTIAQKEYSLFYASKHRYAYDALQKEVKATGGEQVRLIVYPKVMHFPKREQPYLMSFQLVGFDRSREATGIAKELQDFEFRLCGLWQFIPVCQTPCISVFKNFNKERLEYIKSAEPEKKVRFMKASHVPLIWRDAPVRPFRFNPKLDKEQQGHSSFVEVLAKFLPERDVFGFSKLLSEPMEKAPNFLKARKEDKAEALKNKMQLQRSQSQKPKKKVWG